jgi:S1-C subfamily serine protease
VSLGDVIEAVDGEPVMTFDDLVDLLDERGFGERVRLTIRRGRERLKVPITLSGADGG